MNIEDLINGKKTLASIYNGMALDRQTYLDKAKEAAKLTIPSLISDSIGNQPKVASYDTPNQSVGADGINNLSAKVCLTMLPPNQTFYRYSLDEDYINATAMGDVEQHKAKINKGLAKLERMLLDYQEQSNDRVCLGEALKYLYISGNVLLIHDPKDGLKYYPLNRYVCNRDYVGNVLEVITEEKIGFTLLPEEVQDLIRSNAQESGKTEDEMREIEHKDYLLYTDFRRTNKHWIINQELENGIEIPKAQGKYPIEVCPFIALRYTRIDGESYGRGLIEEYIGDLSYLDILSKAIRETSLAASKLLIMVNPQGTTKVQALAKARNGSFVSGKAEDVIPLQANKYYDLNTARVEKENIERRLSRIFVIKAAIQREAERVTAEEIRQMAADLEEALGNHYSIMCKEFQQAYVKITYFHMQKAKKKSLPDLARDKNVKLTVTTGLEALGRTSDLNKLATFFQMTSQFAQAAQILGAKNEPLINKVAEALNLDIEGLFMSDEERAEANKQAQEAQMLQQATPALAGKLGDYVLQKQQMEGNTEQQ